VDGTILHLKGKHSMDSKGLFSGLNKPEQEQYAQEAEQRYDAETVRASNRRWQGYSAQTQEAIMAEGNAVYADMVAAMPHGAASDAVQDIVQRWRDHLEHFWTPGLAQLNGLARIYVDDPRFRANFDRLHPQLAAFMVEAVQHYVAART
jgi:hypothetical protein